MLKKNLQSENYQLVQEDILTNSQEGQECDSCH